MHRLSVIVRIIPVIVALAALAPAGTLAFSQAQPQPPNGFTALFNGRDLTGWYGLEHFDPRTLRAMKVRIKEI